MAKSNTQPLTSQVHPTTGPTAQVLTTPRPAITQTTLAEILRLRREAKEAEKTVKALKHDLSVREEAVIRALEGGATVTQGILTASVRYDERRNVPWRQVAEQYLGADFCGLVAEETEPIIYPRLVVA